MIENGVFVEGLRSKWREKKNVHPNINPHMLWLSLCLNKHSSVLLAVKCHRFDKFTTLIFQRYCRSEFWTVRCCTVRYGAIRCGMMRRTSLNFMLFLNFKVQLLKTVADFCSEFSGIEFFLAQWRQFIDFSNKMAVNQNKNL